MHALDGVEVRAATEADFEALADLQWQWRIEEWHGAPKFERQEFVDALRTWMNPHLESHQAFVARSNTEVVGMGWLAVLERIPTPAEFVRRGGHIQSVYVVPKQRRQGVGNALMRLLIETARELRLGWLLVHPSDQSFSFYRTQGFTPTGRFLELRLGAS
jgi:ribosomal protein S18 acetylase RimI-like enzyme